MVKTHLKDLRKNPFLDKQVLGYIFLMLMTAIKFMVYYSKASFQVEFFETLKCFHLSAITFGNFLCFQLRVSEEIRSHLFPVNSFSLSVII